jgi:hypothetical protein
MLTGCLPLAGIHELSVAAMEVTNKNNCSQTVVHFPISPADVSLPYVEDKEQPDLTFFSLPSEIMNTDNHIVAVTVSGCV